jgi:hypothetical protein
MKSLDEILGDEEGEVAPVVEQAVETETKQPEPLITVPAQGRDEHGRFAPKGVEEGAPPAPKDQLPPEEYKAVRAEREKRQALEQELAQLRAQKQQEPPAPPPSIFDDEHGAFQHFGSEVISQTALQSRVIMSEMLTAQKHDDFGDMKALYLQLEAENPSLIPQVMSDPNPWGKAYEIARAHKRMQELGAVDVDDLKAKLRAEIEAEMAAKAPAARAGLPVSLTTERSVGQRTGPTWSGPRSIEDILNN